jgi:hypothetical protein
MHALMCLKEFKYALKYALNFFNTKMFINKDILLNILVHNGTNIVSILY